MKFEIFQSDKNQKYYFRLKSNNGKIVLSSQAYASKETCLNGIASVRNNGNNENKYETKMVEKQLHFVLKAKNGQVIGNSQVYNSEKSLRSTIESMIKEIQNSRTEDLTLIKK